MKIVRWPWIAPAILLLAQAAVPMPALARAPRAASVGAETGAIDTVIADDIASQKLAGAVVGVMRGGKIVLVKGYGMADLEDDQPVKLDTVFRIGSLTKQFTSAMLLMLVERGQVSLSDPIGRYFPDFPHAEGITVRHLLNHTSGIPNYTNRAFWEATSPLGLRAWRTQSTQEMISYIARENAQPDFPVGTDYRYNNSAYILAGGLVEKLTGKSLAVALQDMIAKPLGLVDTAYDDGARRRAAPREGLRFARRHSRLSDAAIGQRCGRRRRDALHRVGHAALARGIARRQGPEAGKPGDDARAVAAGGWPSDQPGPEARQERPSAAGIWSGSEYGQPRRSPSHRSWRRDQRLQRQDLHLS